MEREEGQGNGKEIRGLSVLKRSLYEVKLKFNALKHSLYEIKLKFSV